MGGQTKPLLNMRNRDPLLSIRFRVHSMAGAQGNTQEYIEDSKTTPVGFEPTRGDPIGLAGRRLNRSAKVSLLKLAVERTRLPLPGNRMLWLDAPDTSVHLAIPLFRGAPNLACQPQLGE